MMRTFRIYSLSNNTGNIVNYIFRVSPVLVYLMAGSLYLLPPLFNSPTLQPCFWQSWIWSLFLWIFFFKIPHINEIIQYLFFSVLFNWVNFWHKNYILILVALCCTLTFLGNWIFKSSQKKAVWLLQSNFPLGNGRGPSGRVPK